MTVERLKNIAYDYYEEYYEDPKGIHYSEIAQQVGVNKRNMVVIDYVAEAIDQGVSDKQNSKEKRTEEELFRIIGEPPSK